MRWWPGPCIGHFHMKGHDRWWPPECRGLWASPWRRRCMFCRPARRHPFFMNASLLRVFPLLTSPPEVWVRSPSELQLRWSICSISVGKRSLANMPSSVRTCAPLRCPIRCAITSQSGRWVLIARTNGAKTSVNPQAAWCPFDRRHINAGQPWAFAAAKARGWPALMWRRVVPVVDPSSNVMVIEQLEWGSQSGWTHSRRWVDWLLILSVDNPGLDINVQSFIRSFPDRRAFARPLCKQCAISFMNFGNKDRKLKTFWAILFENLDIFAHL